MAPMSRLFLAFLFLAVALGGTMAVAPTPVGSQSGIGVVIDADVTGNTPRLVPAVDECVSAGLGDTVEVDIVAPEPGIPGDRGIAAYELTFYYDLNVINVVAADYNQLLKQAPGSNLFAVGSELPDASGEFHAVVGDIGKAGVEPAGTSEVGAGVLSRLKLQVVGAGVTPLGLRGVDLRDDAGNPIAIAESRRGTLYAGMTCPAPTATPSPTPGPVPTTAPAATATAAATGGNVGGGPPAGVGSLAAPRGGVPGWAWGLLAVGVAAGAAGVGALARRRSTR